jgi:CRISPR-associated protein Csc3
MNMQLDLFSQKPIETETIITPIVNNSSVTLLQQLLLKTIEFDPILQDYIQTIVSAMEREFAFTYALGGNEEEHYRRLIHFHQPEKAREIAISRANKADQSLLVHVLNALFIGWRLSKYLPSRKQLSEVEQKLFCLAITLHDYGKQLYEKEEASPKAYQIYEIIKACEKLGEKLNFDQFWQDWKTYLIEIAFLAQNTQFSVGANSIPSNWEIDGRKFLIDERRLDDICHLLAFGDISVHLSDPSEIIKLKSGNKKRSSGDALREHINLLGIQKKLVYHRLRDCRGLLTNGIHNIMLNFTQELDWIPIIYFAQGAVYLAPKDTEIPDLESLQKEIWRQIKAILSNQMKTGEIGFKRDGKGLKVAPQTLELFTASDLILTLPEVVEATVKNEKNPATSKRLEKLDLTESEQDLFNYADLRSDRLGEFIILAQKEFFSDVDSYPGFILQSLNLADKIPVEKTQIQSGGVNYGWYYVASYYISNNRTWDYEETQLAIIKLAENLVQWAENNNLLPEISSPTKQVFFDYLEQYLDVSDGDQKLPNFVQELENYTIAKGKNKAICSLSSGEFLAEEQLDSVVLFKPQQYSNKNSLGGGKIKRGISKIWALEMLLRQARWSGKDKQVSKLEENKPVFLYIFPAYVYSPETIKAVRRLISSELIDINLWDAKKCWIDGKMKGESLQNIAWLEAEEKEDQNNPKYSKKDLPFMATTYTKTRGKTDTDAWVKPAFLALVLPQLLGVKVVATSSPDPLYASDQEFLETVKLDGIATFWNLLGLDTNLRLQDLESALTKLLIIYSIHLDNRSNPPDARWQSLISTVREVMTDVLNVFLIANEGLRKLKRNPYPEEVKLYWRFVKFLLKEINL